MHNAFSTGTAWPHVCRRSSALFGRSLTTSRIPLGRAHLLASTAIREARQAGLPFSSIVPLGSLRRYAPDVGDVSLLAIAPRDRHQEILLGFSRLTFTTRVASRAASNVTVATQRGDVTLYVTCPEQAGAALIWHTGSRRHTDALKARADRRALTLQDGRLEHATGRTVDASTEETVYRWLDLPPIPPELREDGDEVDAADRRALPALVSAMHIRGDLHVHTDWSDGRNSIEEMVLAARQLGYEYVAITDHSERSWASRKLSTTDVPRQRAQLDEVRARIEGIHVLHGVEVDIMQDGSLDFDNALLEGFDVVIASLHDHGGQDGTRLTERYLSAIRHPLVNIIAHPANRSPGLFAGYDVDFERLFAAAFETGTALEIDGAPGHLDMDGALARKAIARGVTVTIDSDGHRADALGRQMRFGLGTARRGWVEPRHVLNTRDVRAIRDFVTRKRNGR
jgi:DNA polymerase (family X)